MVLSEDLWDSKCRDEALGREYTDRNNLDVKGLNRLFMKYYGVSAEKVYKKYFCSHVFEHDKILEVGCGSGNNLLLLESLGYDNLYGIDIQNYAVGLARDRLSCSNIFEGDCCDLPFKDNYFDCVFTSGLLIHFHPMNVRFVMGEIGRVCNRYIFGLEYFNKKFVMKKHRGISNIMWKGDYSRLYCNMFDNVVPIVEKKYRYIGNLLNIDCVFMLMKKKLIYDINDFIGGNVDRV